MANLTKVLMCLQSIESKLHSLSQGIAGPQDDDEMSCQEITPRPGGLLPKFDTGGITSAVALAVSEEKEGNLMLSYIISQSLPQKIVIVERRMILIRSLISFRKF